MWLPLLTLLFVGHLAPPPPSLDGVLNHLGLTQYSQLLESEEIDLPILAQLSEEQLSRIGVRTMGQRMRLLSAAREAIKVTHTEDDGEGEVEEGVNEDGEEEEAGGDGAEGEVGEEAEHEGAGGANEEEDGGGVDEETAEEENQERFELDLKVTSTGKQTHAFTNRFYSKGIKKSGASYFYCNYISGKERCTSRFRVRYHNLENPMEEEPEIETHPGPHVLTYGTNHLPEKTKRAKERMNVKNCKAISDDPLRPIN